MLEHIFERWKGLLAAEDIDAAMTGTNQKLLLEHEIQDGSSFEVVYSLIRKSWIVSREEATVFPEPETSLLTDTLKIL